MKLAAVAIGMMVLGVGVIVAAYVLSAQLQKTTEETVRTRDMIANSQLGKFLVKPS